MKIARIFVLFFASSLIFSSASAQLQRTFTTQPPIMQKLYPKRSLRTAQALPFIIQSLDTNWQDVSDGKTHSFKAVIHNPSAAPLSIYFNRSQRIPSCWISSVCWGPACYAPFVDSMPATIRPDSEALLILDLTAPMSDVADSAAVWLRVGVVGSPADTLLLPFYGSYLIGDPPLVFKWTGDTPQLGATFYGAGPHTISNSLENHLCYGVDYEFSIQDTLPAGWTLHTCLENSYMDSCTTGASLRTNFSAYFDTTYQQQVKFTLDIPQVTKRDSAIIYLRVHPETSNPADAAIYRFVMVGEPSSGVADQNQEASSTMRAGLAVTNAWPNPLHSSSKLHLDILTDMSGPSTAIFYDLTGSEKAVLDLGVLQEGANQVQIGTPNLASGQYIIRVEQGSDAAEVVRVNYIK